MSKVNWGSVDPAYLMEWLTEVSSQGGIISFMYGGYGSYYKVTSNVDGVKRKATSETPEGIVRNVYREILGRAWSED